MKKILTAALVLLSAAIVTVCVALLSGCRALGEKLTELFLPAILLLAGGCLCLVACVSCTITTRNQGEVGFRYGHEITFFHRAAQTAPEPATINSAIPEILEWLLPGPPPPAVEVVTPAQ